MKWGVTGAKSSDSMDIGQVTPWMSCQLIAGPLLMAVAAMEVPIAHQEQFGGSVTCSRILLHVAQSWPGEPGIWTSDLLVTSPQLYPLSYSRPNGAEITCKT